MKTLKKTLALLAALAMTATAAYGCGKTDENNNNSNNNAANNNTSDADKPADDTNTGDDANTNTEDPDAPTGDVLTILCWNANDSEPMVKLFCEKTGTPRDQIYIKNFNCAGGEASEKYDAYLSKEANDADIMFLEADWCLKYINDDNATVPLSNLGFSDSDFNDIYPYVLEIGKSTTTGALKGVSWQAAAGGYCYRTDLAEKYLNVKSEDEMQAKVSDWDGFKATAKELSEATGGKTAITATLGGLWQVYAGSRETGWVTDNKLNVDDFCKNYAEYAKEFYDNGYVTKVTQWSDAWKPLGQTEDTLGYFVSTWGFGDTILTEAAGGEGKGSYGNWKCILGPKEFYWGGTWLAPAARCNNPELAKSFIEFFTTNTETAEAYALTQGEYMSNQKVMEAIIDGKKYAGAGVLGGQNQFEVLNKVAQGIDMAGKISPYDATIKDLFQKAVDQYCQGDLADADACLKKFAGDVAGAIPSLNWN